MVIMERDVRCDAVMWVYFATILGDGYQLCKLAVLTESRCEVWSACSGDVRSM